MPMRTVKAPPLPSYQSKAEQEAHEKWAGPAGVAAEHALKHRPRYVQGLLAEGTFYQSMLEIQERVLDALEEGLRQGLSPWEAKHRANQMFVLLPDVGEEISEPGSLPEPPPV